MADKDNRFLNNMVTEDETWSFLYDSQAKLDLLNGYHHRHHHHLETKIFRVFRNKFRKYLLKDCLCWKFFMVRALSIMILSLNVKLWINKRTLTSSVAPGMWSERNAPKMENQQLVSPSQQCSSTPVGFVKGFLSKKQYDDTGAFHILSWPGSSWFLPVSATEISTEGTARG
jgi:hypothetical protein